MIHDTQSAQISQRQDKRNVYIYIYIYLKHWLLICCLLVSGWKSFAASKVTKVTQPLSLSRFSVHLADFLIIFHFSIQIFQFIFNKCWLDVFFTFKVFFKIWLWIKLLIPRYVRFLSNWNLEATEISNFWIKWPNF